MNNKTIKKFFKIINLEVSNVHTTKALRILDKRCKNIVLSLSGKDIKNSLHALALKEYKKTKILIEKKNRSLN